MKRAVLLSNLVILLPLAAAVNVPLTIQEAIYPGSVAGISRTGDPVTAGIPLPDDPVNGVSDVNQLTLSGASVGQFRVLGRWPSGRIKWVQVDTQASLAAGQKNTSIALTSGGSGNFGGSNLATDNGATITVSTGAATFTIQKANFNVIDQVVVGSTVVVASGASQGMVLLGPDASAAYPGNAICSPLSGGSACATVYSSRNDASSTCSIEDNGPAMASIKCTGAHVDSAGHKYMEYTVREYFYKGKTYARIVPTLRNAAYGTSNTFATAHKSYQGYEIRISPNLSGTLNYTIAAPTSGTGCNGSTCTGTLNQAGGTDYAYLYQAESDLMKPSSWCPTGNGCIPYTSLSGYSVIRNGTALTTGTVSQYPRGWADISNSAGAGVQIGQYQFAAYGNKSLEFRSGGTDVRVGIWAAENNSTSTSTLTGNTPYAQAWPQWNINPDVYLNFHDQAPASLDNAYLSQQHYLLARAGYQQYNQAGVFPQSTTTLIDPTVEDGFYSATGAAANPALPSSRICCIQDYGLTDGNFLLSAWRFYNWPMGSGTNQTEFRWSQLLNFITRGFSGRYLDSANFYRFQAGTAFPMSDGFNWRDKPLSERDGFGQPKATSAGTAMRVWHDQEHNHSYGIYDYYFMSGDETIHDAALEMKDWFAPTASLYQSGGQDGYKVCTVSTNGVTVTLSSCSGGATFNSARWQYQTVNINAAGYVVTAIPDATHLTLGSSAGVQNNVTLVFSGGLSNTRAVGGELLGAARLYNFLTATGDSDAGNVLKQGVNDYITQVTGQLCASGYPAGCTFGPVDGGGDQGQWSSEGVSRTRGMHVGYMYGYTSSWCGVSHTYRVAKPFMAGILLQGILELRDAMGPSWSEYLNSLDLAYGISGWALSEMFADDGSGRWDINGFRYSDAIDVPTTCSENDFTIQAQQTVSGHFLAKHLVEGGTGWSQKFKINLQKDMSALGLGTSDFGSYQVSSVINALNTSSPVLSNIAINSLTDNGGGNYTITWTVPAGAQNYRIKWAPNQIVDWIGYDNVNGVFLGNPATTTAWFAATNAPSLPAPLAAGTTQSLTISTGVLGLTVQCFSVKAYISGGAAAGPAATLSLISGNNQTGTAGQALASPLTVKVTDAAGNPVAGVAVQFAVTSGGGSLSNSSVSTDSLGLASTGLTLGAAAGANTVTATSGSLSGSPVTFTATGVAAGTAKNLVLVSGNSQSGIVGQALASPFVVKVTDSAGNTVSGVSVTFTVTSGGGTVNPSTVSTDSQGLASSTLTLGATAGANTVTAVSGTLTGSPITFTATGNPASTAAAISIISGNNQTGSPGQALASPFTIRIQNSSGHGVSGVAVIFAVTGGGGILSAAVASTDSSGQASSTLTLGSTAGTNTVTVTTVSLPGSSVIFTATATGGLSAASANNITWTKQALTAGAPNPNDWFVIPYDPVSGQTVVFATSGGGIYSSDLFFYKPDTNAWTKGPGTGSRDNGCPADTATVPGDRHPLGEITIDTKRNFLWLSSGINARCGNATVSTNGTAVTWVSSSYGNWVFPTGGQIENQTVTINGVNYVIASVQDSTHLTLKTSAGVQSSVSFQIVTGTETSPRYDLYYMPLNADPSKNTWHQLKPAHFAQSAYFSSMVYDPDDDVLFQFGYDYKASTHDNWVYCRTAENPTPGVLTAKQSAAGCTAPDDWSEVIVTGGVQPLGDSNPGMLYDPVTKKVLVFGGQSNKGGLYQAVVWAYDVPTHTWTQKGLTTTAPPLDNTVYWGQPAWAYNSATGKVLYHYTGGGTGSTSDWQYDPVADTWTQLVSNTGAVSTNCPNCAQVLAYDSGRNLLVGYNRSPSNGTSEIWLGTLSTAGRTANGCDLNGDGVVNAIDIQIAIGQSLGSSTCSTADLNKDGVCNVIDVQRVINASAGGTCRIGQ
jgi:YetA-like protein/Bacterial Ig-like domain (group 1)/Dockerin type I domain